ncbi:MAG: hypothetical protein HRU26_06415 [Psychroserpens sp.]|nr:hypothetical protein [Psychroserpens sp.]
MRDLLKNGFIYLCLIGVMVSSFFGCKSVSIDHKQHQKTVQKIILTNLGQDDDFLFESDYSQIGGINLTNPIPLNWKKIEFNKSTYTAFNSAKYVQGIDLEIPYSDSLKVKPYFMNIEIAHKINFIKAINNDVALKAYLEHQSEAHIISGITIALSSDQLQTIENSDELLLQSLSPNLKVLVAQQRDMTTDSIYFNDGVVFTYRKARACWKENSRSQLEIIDLVEGDQKCPSGSYKVSSKAREKINFYKF